MCGFFSFSLFLKSAINFSIEFLVKTYQNKWIVSTKRVIIAGEERLEGMLREGAGKGGVVICHPHPLYGGSMWNNVVDALETGFFEAGFSTLRFNFRGVGASSGRYDEGEGETRDVEAACRHLEEHTGGGGRFVLAGYSFGAWVAARAACIYRGSAPPPSAELPGHPLAGRPRSARFASIIGVQHPLDGQAPTSGRCPASPLGSLGARFSNRDLSLCLVAYPFSVYRAEELRAFRGRVCFVGGSLTRYRLSMRSWPSTGSCPPINP